MSTEPTEAPARDEVESTVHRLLAEILYVEPEEVDLETGFIDLGLDSILAVEYVAQLKSELGVSETIEELHDLGTPRALVDHILAESAAA
ncbi:acyl carrier protein [Actinomadura sp. DC4]|uniref:acyl carrier protein n=1 Tax=Actinomadura sp. DC4 TaxID=3055069 RepID=UPI0025B20303|nr:acyl carrier protein [Actinomadura sp. DC4]MDN3354260.1 acyl carrier protein [Actinomadura sp. DC4]